MNDSIPRRLARWVLKDNSESVAYKQSDPEAVTAYYCIHFKPALARAEDYEKIVARTCLSFIQRLDDSVVKSGADFADRLIRAVGPGAIRQQSDGELAVGVNP